MAYAAPGHTAATLKTIVGNAMGWSTPDTPQSTKIYEALTEAALAAASWQGEDWWWLRGTGNFTFSYGAITSTGLARATNVVTVTTSAAHGIATGDLIVVQGADSSTFHGVFTVASAATTTTLTYAQTDSNETSGGGVVVKASYALRTVNSNTMQTLWGVQRVYYDDDWDLAPMNYREYRQWWTVDRPTAGTSLPTGGMVTGEPPYFWPHPLPSAKSTIYVDYTMRHSKITSSSVTADFIVPAEFQDGIYAKGATYLLRHEKKDIASLKECPGFMEAIERMVANKPENFDDNPANKFGDVAGTWPNNRKVIAGLIENEVSIP